MARAENPGVLFFVNKLPPGPRRIVDAVGALLVVFVSAAVAYDAVGLGLQTTGQTTGSGLPLQWNFYPMAVGGACMTVFAFDLFLRRKGRDMAIAIGITAVVLALYFAWSTWLPDSVPGAGTLMALGFVVTLFGGLPIGFALALAALIFIWVGGTLPGVIFAQQMARGIDDFVLLAIPFFILVGYLMEANGMSARLIALLQRLVGPRRGGMNVVMVVAMVLFSGISGSKTADVAAVGTVLVPAARKAGQNPGNAVALLAASAVMAETIPPCLNLIILGFVGNLSIGGLFMAGVIPALMMAVVLVAFCVIAGKRPVLSDIPVGPQRSMLVLWRDSAPTLGLILTIFIGFKSGFATATEISAFAALYALVVGGVVFRELGPRAIARSFIHAARRSGLVLFIVAAAQSVAFTLTLQQVPDAVAVHDDCAVPFRRRGDVHGAVDCCADSDGLDAGRGGGADCFRAALDSRGEPAWDRSVAVRRGAGDLHGDRAVRAAAWVGPVRGVPDRQRADGDDGEADPWLSRAVAALRAGHCLCSHHQLGAAACPWLLNNAPGH